MVITAQWRFNTIKGGTLLSSETKSRLSGMGSILSTRTVGEASHPVPGARPRLQLLVYHFRCKSHTTPLLFYGLGETKRRKREKGLLRSGVIG